jgi:AsmA protein
MIAPMTLLQNKYLRAGLIGFAAVVVVALALPFVVPAGAYRDRIETAVGEATGRALHIEGPLRFTLFPFGLKAEKVTFANMPGGRAAAMASVGDIRLAVRFWPLLMGHLEVGEIVLDKPVIALEVDRVGHANWMIGKHHGSQGSGGAVTLPTDTIFSGIKINDGEISYINAKSQTDRAFEHVNATVALTRLDLPVLVDGNLMLGGRLVDFDAKLTTIKALLTNAPTLLNLSLTSDLMQASFEGVIAPDGGINGTLKCDSEHLRPAAAWLGARLPEGGGFGAISLEARFSNKDKVTALSPFRLVLDRATITGGLSVDTKGKIPSLQGSLAIDRLDLNPYLEAPRGKAGTHYGPHHAESGWSTEPINLSLLKEADAELTLSAGSLRVRGLRLDKTLLNISLEDGLLTARLDPISLYGGSGHALLMADTRGVVPKFRNTLQFDRIALLPFLSDTLGVDHIQGTGALKLDIAAQGGSATGVMHTLGGKGSIAIGPGRIRGVDLGQVAREIATVLGVSATGDFSGTDFSDLGGSFVLTDGVLANRDFRMDGPLLSATGAGSVDIAGRALDFRLVPKATIQGIDIGIPFRIKGSWDHVEYTPDYAGIANGVIQNLENRRAPFKGLFGSGKPKDRTQDQKQQPKKKKSLGDKLKNMLGIH